jgi:hypothetical protein
MNYTKKTTQGFSCPKAGVKIFETQSQMQIPLQIQIPQQMQTEMQRKPFVSFHQTKLADLDLNVDNYSLEELYNLFNISNGVLNEPAMKTAKQIVLKIHPDKSQLDAKYFLFFSKAYKRLFNIYEFQNKSSKKSEQELKKDYYEDTNTNVLNNMFESRKELKDSKNFNSWFNEKFEKHKIEDDDTNKGYGDWLKSDDGFYLQNEDVTQSNMGEAFERQKKQIQSLTVYNGINDTYASFSSGGSLLGEQLGNFSGSSSGLGYTDLKQAHIETIIPVTHEDYERIPKYKNVNEYKAGRDRVDVTPISKAEAERILHQNNNRLEHESAALAYKYAKESERVKANQKSFWSDIKQLL